MQRISVTLPDDLAKTFYQEISKGERSQFVIQAIADSLRRGKKRHAFESLKQFKPFSTDQDSTDILSKIRDSRGKQVAHKGEQV